MLTFKVKSWLLWKIPDFFLKVPTFFCWFFVGRKKSRKIACFFNTGKHNTKFYCRHPKRFNWCPLDWSQFFLADFSLAGKSREKSQAFSTLKYNRRFYCRHHKRFNWCPLVWSSINIVRSQCITLTSQCIHWLGHL